MALFCALFASAQTTQFTGTVKDLTNTPVASGIVNFALQPGADTTISGVGRFTPQTVTCSIVNQSISAISRATNVTTVTTGSAHGFTTGDLVNIVGVTDATYNANGVTITVTDATHFTYANTGTNGSSSAGFAGNIFRFGGTGACTVVNNTALNPSGTSYKVQLCPFSACTSQFNAYATGGVVDLTSVVPTPSTLPAFNFVDIFSNQTIGGNKTFSGTITAGGAALGSPTSTGTDNGAETLVNKTLTSPTVTNPSTTGTDSGAETLTNKTLTSPTSTGTDSGSETLANKTLTSPVVTNPSTTGTDSGAETLANKTLTSPTLSAGVAADGSGFKHKRVVSCTVAAGANNTCTTVITWGTPFADGNYTASCTLFTTFTFFYLTRIANVAASTMTVEITNGPGGVSSNATIECIAVHD